MAAVFAIDQARPGPSPGTPGIPRKDIWLAWQVNLRSTGTGSSFQWFLLDKPPASAVTINSATSATANFTPDVAGTYRVMLVVDGGGPGNTMVLVVGVCFDHAGVLTNRGWRLPAVGETNTEDNFDGLNRGWAEAFEFMFPDLLSVIGGGAGVGGDLSGTIAAAAVVGIQGRPVLSTAPGAGTFLGWNGSAWAPLTVTSFTAGQDLSGTPTSQTVIGIQNRPVLSTAPGANQFLGWNGAAWAPLTVVSFSAGGDLSGTPTNQTVIGLQGRPLNSTAPSTGSFIGWNGAAWAPSTSIGTNILTAGGVDAAAGLNLGTTTATSVGIGRLGQNTIIYGNLIVQGTTTEVSSTVVDISDRLIHLNWAALAVVPVPANIAGIDIDRGSADGITPRDAAAIVWDESASRWKVIFNTHADGSTIGAFLDFQANTYFGVAVNVSGAISGAGITGTSLGLGSGSITAGAIGGTSITVSGLAKSATAQITGLASGVLGVDAVGNVLIDTGLPQPREISFVAGVFNTFLSTPQRFGSRIVDLTGVPTTLADGRTLTVKFICDIETTAGTCNVQMKNMTDNELVTNTSFTTTSTQNTEFSGTLTVGVAAGNLKTAKLYEVDVWLTGASGLDRATITNACLVFSYA